MIRRNLLNSTTRRFFTQRACYSTIYEKSPSGKNRRAVNQPEDDEKDHIDRQVSGDDFATEAQYFTPDMRIKDDMPHSAPSDPKDEPMKDGTSPNV